MRGFCFVAAAAVAGHLLAQPARAAEQSVQEALRSLAPSGTERIYGGEPAPDEAWPWQVYIQIPALKKGSPVNYQCGGSLIARQWVLTAAHCFHPRGALLDRSRPITIAERSANQQKLGFKDVDFAKAHLTKIIVEHEFNPSTFENDIALPEPARAQSISILVVPNGPLEAPPTRAKVTGWGMTRDIDERPDGYYDLSTNKKVGREDFTPHVLQQVEVPLVRNESCKAHYGKSNWIIDARNLCAGELEGGKDSCTGDSGGPIMVYTSRNTWMQIRVVSWGNGCGRAGYPGVYTRVSAFGDWIQSVVGRDLVILPDRQNEAVQPASPGPTPRPDFDNSAGLTIAFDEGDEVSVGDLVSYRVTARKPGYLAVFDAKPDGKLTQVFPNAFSMDSPTGANPDAARVQPGRPLLIPNYRNQYRGFDVLITEPRGKGMIVAVLSERPIRGVDIPVEPRTFGSIDEAITAIGRLRRELTARGLGSPGRAADRPNWSVDMHEYTIR